MEGLGSHHIVELYDCNEDHLNDVKKIEAVMLKAAELSGITVVKEFFHEFSPYGISGVLIIAESHFTIHTWPEHAYAAVDIFSCGEIVFESALNYIKAELEAEKSSVFHFNRGIFPGKNSNRELSKIVGKNTDPAK